MSAPNGGGGSVHVYRTSTIATWSALGDPITIGGGSRWFGGAVELSGDGRVVAVSDPIATANVVGADPVPQAGTVFIFDYDATTTSWNRRGQPIMGIQPQDRLGMAMSLSPDGTTVAYSVADVARRSSKVVVRRWVDRSQLWEALGQELLPERPGDMFGGAISLMDTGLAVGAVRIPLRASVPLWVARFGIVFSASLIGTIEDMLLYPKLGTSQALRCNRV